MAKTLELPELRASETGSIIQESLEKVAHALEIERNKLRELAEQDSSQIIARAREEADKIIAQARQDAKVESDKLIAKLKQEAEKIIKESCEKASIEARQESARIIHETREKTAQIFTEVIERGITQAKSKFVGAASKARSGLESEKSKLLTVTKSIEQIIDETETNIQAGIEYLTNVITETERKLQILNEVPHSETVASSQQVSEKAISIEKIIDETETNLQAGIKQLTTVITENERTPQISNEVPHSETVVSSQQVSEKAKIPEHSEKLERQITEQAAGEKARIKTEEVKNPQCSDDADKRMQEGMVLLESGKNKEALDAFLKVIELDPKNALAWRKKGSALGLLGRHRESLEAIVRAIQLNPMDATAWHNKGIALTKLGKNKEAKEAKEAEKRVRKEAEQAAK
jgi:tetratricopeptide (TPR) repeat protein